VFPRAEDLYSNRRALELSFDELPKNVKIAVKEEMSETANRLVMAAAKAVAFRNPYGIPPEVEPKGNPTIEEIELAKDVVLVVLREAAAIRASGDIEDDSIWP